MKYYFSLFLLFSFLPFVLNCKGNTHNNPGKENSTDAATPEELKPIQINALYYNYVFASATPVKPENIKKNIPRFEIDPKGVLDATITDTAKIKKIQELLANLKPSAEQTPMDARIVINLYYNDGSNRQICIGGIYTDKIYLNGVEQVRDNKVLFTLKNYIGFYPWLIGDYMFKMSELQDNSFLKAPFISTRYYKEYQKILNGR